MCLWVQRQRSVEDQTPEATHDDNGRVQTIDVSPSNTIADKLFRFPAVHSEEVGTRVIGPQRIEEFFEDGMETVA